MRERYGPSALAGATEAGDRVYAGQRPDTTPRRLESPACNAAAAAGFGGKPPPKRLRLVAWRPFVRGALHGFATVELPIGLKLVDCPVLVSKGEAWASLPSKPVLDRDGRQKTDVNGKPAYAAILEWRTRDLADRFAAAVVELVRRAHPDALGEAGR
jgi:hypothetical protein